MSFLNQVSVLILTFNEASNIGRTLEALRAFSEIVVLDSGSADATLDIVRHFPNTRSVVRPFDGHAVQWNYGLVACGLEREWVLALDADYCLPQTLVDEIAGLSPVNSMSGYRASFRYCVLGHPLARSLYPPTVVLYRRSKARYVQEGHTQRVLIEGDIDDLRDRIYHDDRKPLSHWLASQQNYAKLEIDHLFSKPQNKLSAIDKIRLLAWPAPILMFIYVCFVRGCVLDGWHGWFYILQRTLTETMFTVEIVDRRLRNRASTSFE